MAPGQDADRNLLFGINALQNDFITRDALIAAMGAWALAKHRTLGEILVEARALDPGDCKALEAMITRRLGRHDNDPARSLAALSSVEGLADALRRSILDPETRTSIARVPADPDATHAPDPTGYVPVATRYRKVRDHARGGLGIVYVALDEELRREVALKEIQPEYADNLASQARFLLEAEITGGLEHPGIVPVYGLGHYDDGRPFYAMRFIKGDSLKHAIAGFHADPSLTQDPGARTLALQKLLRRFLDVCNAVAYAHSRGVLHRDLKPDNVMVGKYGETLVVDWGLAKSVGRSGENDRITLPEATLNPASASGSAETLPGSVIGTPAYMSPEQAAGRLDLLGPASDVYSLGATLYTLLTGRVPFVAKDLAEVLREVEHGEFARPRESTPWLDPALEAVTLKAMALAPDARYASPKALADDIERWLADEPVTAHGEPWTRKAGRWARKHRTAVTAAASTATIAALLLGSYAGLRSSQRRETDASALVLIERAESLAIEARVAGDLSKWEKVIAEGVRAEDRLDAGGGSLAARREVSARLGVLRAGRDRRRIDLQADERDRRMVAALGEARLLRAAIKDGHFDDEAKLLAYLAAFRAHDIDLGSLPTEESARRIRSSRIADELIAALDDWPAREGANVPASQARAIARAAETDPGRAEIRDAAERGDAASLRRICGSEEARRKLGPRLRLIFNGLRNLDPVANLPLLEAIRREHPSDFWLNQDLGLAYLDHSPPESMHEAVRCLSAAVALRPASVGAHQNLGLALSAQGKADRAIAEFREAIRIQPEHAGPHDYLSLVLAANGDLDGSIAEAREAARLYAIKPEAMSYPVRPLTTPPSPALPSMAAPFGTDEDKLGQGEQMMPKILKGEVTPRGTGERLAFADLCARTGRFAAAVGFADGAFAEEPAIGDDLTKGFRYNAACLAAMAGSGQGKDDPPPGEAGRARLLAQALDWLRADLSAWKKAVDDESKASRNPIVPGKPVPVSEAPARWMVARTLAHWKQDSDLAGIRDDGPLAKLPAGRREAFQALWLDVEALRIKASGEKINATGEK